MILDKTALIWVLSIIIVIKFIILPLRQYYKHPEILRNSSNYIYVTTLLQQLKYEYEQWKTRRQNKKWMGNYLGMQKKKNSGR